MQKNDLYNFSIKDNGGDTSKPWYIEWRDKRNQRKRYSKGINKYTDPQKRYDAINRAIEKIHKQTTLDTPTIHKKIKKALDTIKKTAAPSTHYTYQSTAKIFLQRITEFTQAAAEKFIQDIKHPSTKSAYRIRLQYLLKIAALPPIFGKTQPNRPAYTQKKILSHDEITRIIAHAKHTYPAAHMLIRLMYYTYLRPSEAAQTTISQIDINGGFIRRQYNTNKSKTTNAVPIPTTFLLQLRPIVHQYPPHYYIIGPDGNPSPTPIPRHILFKQIRACFKHFGYGYDYSAYSFRHSSACDSITNGRTIAELSRMMGHSSIAITETYIKQFKPTEKGINANTPIE
jgi:integrase